MPKKILETKQLSLRFGGLKAVDNLDLSIDEGEMVGLIGPNGAGKTTVFNMLTGVYQPSSGQIFFREKNLLELKPYQISRLGMTRTFQNIRLFKELSVIDNIKVAGTQNLSYSWPSALLQDKKFFSEEVALTDTAMSLLGIFGMENKATKTASSLSYGDQRKLEIIRALATKPKLICLDEPAAGLNHQETLELMQTIAQIRRDFSLAILLIEHDMKLVMGICEKIIVLDHGIKIAEGPPSMIQKSKAVIEAYLGLEAEGS